MISKERSHEETIKLIRNQPPSDNSRILMSLLWQVLGQEVNAEYWREVLLGIQVLISKEVDRLTVELEVKR